MEDLTDASSPVPQPRQDGDAAPSSLSSPEEAELDRPVAITVTHAGQTRTFHFPTEAVLEDLTLECEDAWGPEYDWSSHKFIAPPPAGLLKATERSDQALAPLAGKKLRLLATKLKDVDALRSAADLARRHEARRAAQRRTARTARPQRKSQARAHDDATYTFLQIRPLQGLPNPQRSAAFLERLRDDPGIRAAMRAHRFTVGLLTEMDPLSYTQESHEGTTRILGLNRNKGEVIELRLRTDAYDGYRDYRTIRKTLCHELAHNVHGPHDRQFWDLCHQIEKEVDAADWKSGGRSVGEGGPVYDPHDREEALDHGGWTGGEFVLGSGPSRGGAAGGSNQPGLSRREILAKAAEERIRRMNEESPGGRGEGSSSK